MTKNKSTSKLHAPIFGVNFKSYIWGERALKISKIIDKVAKDTDSYLYVMPQLTDVPVIAKEVEIPVFAPYMDALRPGRGTGFILPEAVKDAGATGVFINHTERKLSLTKIEKTIRRAKEVDLISIVACDTPNAAGALAILKPDIIVPEPPDLIGTLRSVAREQESFAIQSVKITKKVNKDIYILLGGGVATEEDIIRIIELGADGTGAARAICESKDPFKLLTNLVGALERAWKFKHEKQNNF
ncbi:MAG: triose-phosphate isomerase [Nitrososphaeria archaeon]